MVLMVLLISPVAGITGLAFGIPIIVLIYVTCPNWFGHLFVTACCLAWSTVRWRMIRSNVAKYHLEKSTNALRTWIGCFLAFGVGAPAVSGQLQPSLTGTVSLDDDFGGSFDRSGDEEEGSSDSSCDCCEESAGNPAAAGPPAIGDIARSATGRASRRRQMEKRAAPSAGEEYASATGCYAYGERHH